jgi:hypothetical protein
MSPSALTCIRVTPQTILLPHYPALSDLSLCLLQLQEPDTMYRAPVSQLPYCWTGGVVNQTYQTEGMVLPDFQHNCTFADENSIVFPADEINAMFVTTRLTTNNVFVPQCECNVACDASVPADMSLSVFSSHTHVLFLSISPSFRSSSKSFIL